MNHEVLVDKGYKFIETQPGKEVILLLHGLLGALSNFRFITDRFKEEYNVVIPILPIMELPLKGLGIKSLVQYVEEFVDYKNYGKVNVLGNSLGGHLAQLYALKRPEKIRSMILTGSSGLFESAMGNSFPKRGDYGYIKKKAEDTFYDPATATKELVDEIYDIVNDRSKGIRIVITAKSAVRNNLAEHISEINAPSLLIWGRNDKVTPAFVGEKFHELLPNSRLEFIDKCGHAPMMERPEEFNEILAGFLADVVESTTVC